MNAAPVNLLLAAGGAAIAVWAHHAFWTRRLAAPPRQDELLFAETRDGWRLALGHRRARGPARHPPVLLVPGLAANRGAMDFGLERWSLAAHLAAAGFETFALDLRGHGDSRPGRGAPRRWGFDAYAQEDLPAAIDRVRAATGAPRVAVVGHSQGGLLGLAACELYPERVAAVVAMGSPVFWSRQEPRWILHRLLFVFLGRLNRFLSQCVAPFSGFWHPPVSEVVINARNVPRPVMRRLLANVIEDVSLPVLEDFTRWITTDTWAARDGFDYRAALARCRQPALFVCAAADRLAPPAVVRRAAEAWGGPSTLVEIGKAGEASVDYGHSDVLCGREAPREVHARVAQWLAALPEERVTPPPSARRPAAPAAPA